MKLRFTSFVLFLALASAFVFTPLTGATKTEAAAKGVTFSNVTGTVTNAAGAVSTFTGSVALQKFAVQNGQLVVVGALLDAAGKVLGTFTAPVIATATCTILDLDIGAIHLNLLGLVIDLAPIHLDITAVSGPGNLLGNLLCAIAGLLDGDLPLNLVSDQLNILLGVLRALGIRL